MRPQPSGSVALTLRDHSSRISKSRPALKAASQDLLFNSIKKRNLWLSSQPSRPLNIKHTKPLHRSSYRRPSCWMHLFAERQPAARPEIRLQAGLVQTVAGPRWQAAEVGHPSGSSRRFYRRIWTSIRPLRGTMTRSFSRRAGRRMPSSWAKAGPMRCAKYIPTSAFTLSGITGETAGNAMQAFASTTCCSARWWLSD
jgi:hypothetical protein